ncbi:MAG: peptidylprolyl isomerase [Actinomycetota bacterium]|nr:peptidylprolyl isomerase [Actinomycetota bacterium]
MKSRRRPPIRLAAVALAALGTVVASGCTSTVGYAARVNDSVISQDTLNHELADISANKKYVQLIDQQGGSGPVAGTSAGTYNKAFVAVLLDQQVRFEIIRQRLASSNALPKAAQVASAQSTVAQAFPNGLFTAFPARYQHVLSTQQAEADAFVKVASADLSSDGLNQFYQSHLIDYATEACVSHILIADKNGSGQLDYNASLAHALKVKAQLAAGGDFAALAKQYSQDNQGTSGGSAAQGGVLPGSAPDGCMTTQDIQQLVAEFAQSVLSLPVNQVSDPVRTQFGYHLIEVTKRVIEPLDATVAADIHQRVAGQRLNQLVAKARVKINPEFGSFSTKPNANGQITGVTPPLVPNVLGKSTASPTPSTTNPPAGG